MTRLSEHRARSARGRRTAGAYSYSHQPPRPVAELTLPAEISEPAAALQADRFALPAVLAGIEIPKHFQPLAGLPPLAISKPLADAEKRLALQGLQLDQLLAGPDPSH